jgi:hypothetical protein
MEIEKKEYWKKRLLEKYNSHLRQQIEDITGILNWLAKQEVKVDGVVRAETNLRNASAEFVAEINKL